MSTCHLVCHRAYTAYNILDSNLRVAATFHGRKQSYLFLYCISCNAFSHTICSNPCRRQATTASWKSLLSFCPSCIDGSGVERSLCICVDRRSSPILRGRRFVDRHFYRTHYMSFRARIQYKRVFVFLAPNAISETDFQPFSFHNNCIIVIPSYSCSHDKRTATLFVDHASTVQSLRSVAIFCKCCTCVDALPSAYVFRRSCSKDRLCSSTRTP